MILSAAAPRTTKALEPEATLAANSQTSNASETRPPSSSAEQSIPLPQIADRAKELHSRDQISQMRGIQSVVDRVQQELNAIQTTRSKVQEQLNLVLTLQNQISQQDQQITEVLTKLSHGRRQLRGHIFGSIVECTPANL
ncbi:MAG TPA: hypothetical protein VFI45_13100 [Candidatus Acidoferrum sp.]|nr:hypothetical protein [Candidatus Acidoferrum sp.]